MLPKSGGPLPNSQLPRSDRALASLIGTILKSELGPSRRAAKTIMRWTGVSDHTARSWLNGASSPSSLHMLELASNSPPVMAAVLRITGHDGIAVAIDLAAAETSLMAALKAVREAQERVAR